MWVLQASSAITESGAGVKITVLALWPYRKHILSVSQDPEFYGFFICVLYKRNIVLQNNTEIWKAISRSQKVNLLSEVVWRISQNLKRCYLACVHVHEVQHLRTANTEQVLFLHYSEFLLKFGAPLRNSRSPETSKHHTSGSSNISDTRQFPENNCKSLFANTVQRRINRFPRSEGQTMNISDSKTPSFILFSDDLLV